MNEIILMHSKDKFNLSINNTEIKNVIEYKLSSKAEDKGINELIIKIPIDMNKSSIDINS